MNSIKMSIMLILVSLCGRGSLLYVLILILQLTAHVHAIVNIIIYYIIAVQHAQHYYIIDMAKFVAVFFCVQFLVSSLLSLGTEATKSFTIDYEKDTFLKDGQPFRLVFLGRPISIY